MGLLDGWRSRKKGDAPKGGEPAPEKPARETELTFKIRDKALDLPPEVNDTQVIERIFTRKDGLMFVVHSKSDRVWVYHDEGEALEERLGLKCLAEPETMVTAREIKEATYSGSYDSHRGVVNTKENESWQVPVQNRDLQLAVDRRLDEKDTRLHGIAYNRSAYISDEGSYAFAKSHIFPRSNPEMTFYDLTAKTDLLDSPLESFPGEQITKSLNRMKELSRKFTRTVRGVEISHVESGRGIALSAPDGTKHVLFPEVESQVLTFCISEADETVTILKRTYPPEFYTMDATVNSDCRKWPIKNINVQNNAEQRLNVRSDTYLMPSATGSHVIFSVAGNKLMALDKTSGKLTVLASNCAQSGAFSVNPSGSIAYATNEKPSRIKIIETNFANLQNPVLEKREKEADERREREELLEAAQAEALANIQLTVTRKGATNLITSTEAEQTLSQKYGKLKDAVTAQWSNITSDGDTVEQLYGTLQAVSDQLKSQIRTITPGIPESELDTAVSFCLKPIKDQIEESAKEQTQKKAEPLMQSVRSALAGTLTIATIENARASVDELNSLSPHLTDDQRTTFTELRAQFSQKAAEIYRSSEGEIITQAQSILAEAKRQLDAIDDSIHTLDTWRQRSDHRKRLVSHLSNCPTECHTASQKLTEMVAELDSALREKEKDLTERHEQVRAKAMERTTVMVELIKEGIPAFLGRIKRQPFGSRVEAEQSAKNDAQYLEISEQITDLAKRDPESAEKLRFQFKSEVAAALYEMENARNIVTTDEGRPMVTFGKNSFPVWEGSVKEKGERKVDLTFQVDNKTKGPGMRAKDLLGDIAVDITTASGHQITQRLYESLPNEDEWRYEGRSEWRGKNVAGSYISQEEFNAVRKAHRDWSKGEKSQLRRTYDAFRKELSRIYREEVKPLGTRSKEGSSIIDEARAKYTAKFAEFSQFCFDNHILACRRLDAISKSDDPEYQNGKGRVPEYKYTEWVETEDTKHYLDEMADRAKYQMESGRGAIKLKGHAGTGKDVLVEMFAAKTKRPLFAFDCSKWTTEFELSEDLQLDSSEGAAFTKYVESVVVQAMKTPGAILYFNEFNAMPHSAHIYLHSLFDGKRQLTLKTQGSKVEKADSTVLMFMSLNPKYPGTYEPQDATQSRLADIPVSYPPLTRPNTLDSKPEPIYSCNEALMIAKKVPSLKDLTVNPDLSRNEFVEKWNSFINLSQPQNHDQLSAEQQFDMEVILALISYTANIRNSFDIFYKDQHAGVELTAAERTQAVDAQAFKKPISLREIDKCAWDLGKMGSADKVSASADPALTARKFLEKHYLSHYDFEPERMSIMSKLESTAWRPKKRIV